MILVLLCRLILTIWHPLNRYSNQSILEMCLLALYFIFVELIPLFLVTYGIYNQI